MKSSIQQLVSGVILLVVVMTTLSVIAKGQTITLGEAVDNTSLTWTTGGDAEWFGQTSVYYYGGDAARSGGIDEGTSWILTTVTGPGTLHFYCLWSDSHSWSDFDFYIDGIWRSVCWGETIDPFSTWEWQAYLIPPGSHVLKWDVSYPWWYGHGLLDRVLFTEGPGPTLGEALDNTTLVWTTGGTTGKEWFGQAEQYRYGDSAAYSGVINRGESSWIETTVAGPGFLSFYWELPGGVMEGFPRATFLVDGTGWASQSCYSYVIGGANVLKTIPSGNHTLRWVADNYRDCSRGAVLLDKVVYIQGPALMVSRPNGGETARRRDFYQITWLTTEGVGSSVKLELYCGDQLRHIIATDTENDGNYDWLVPLQLATEANCRIKIASASDPSVYDYSDGDFAIGEDSPPGMGGLLLLDGSDDYAESADDAELDIGDEEGEALTVEAWVNVLLAGDATIVEKEGAYRLSTQFRNSPYGRLWSLQGELWFQDSTYRNIGVYISSSGWKNHWHHVALVYNRPTTLMSLYVDGRQAVTATATSLLANTSGGLHIGDHLNGAIDEVRISDVARYTGLTYPVPTALFVCDLHTRALWHFDEYEGANVFHDACGTDNALEGHNGAHTVGIPTHKVYLPLVLR